MSKIALGPLLRHLVTLLIGFFVARHMLSHDVAEKLYKGDTVELWGGAWSVNIKQVTDFLMNCWPVILPIVISVRGRLLDKYKLIVARLSGGRMTNTAVEIAVAKTPITEIISTVVAKP